MQTLKIKLVDWWEEDFKENYFIKFLNQYYEVIQSDHPDLILCSVFGDEYLNYNCPRILFLGENVMPDFNVYDYAIGFHSIHFTDRYLRYPLYLIYQEALQKAQNKHLDLHQEKMLKRDFCSFVVSNAGGDKMRENYFDALSQIDFVASGGRFRNNIGSPVQNKLQFIQNYKFNLAFENTSYPEYCTEKLIEALGAKTIPIYWGDPTLQHQTIINPKAFVNLHQFSCIQESLDYIQYLHHTPEEYLKILQEKAFLIDDIQAHFQRKLKDFFENIINNSHTLRRPNPLNYWHSRKIFIGGGGTGIRSTSRIYKMKKMLESIFKTNQGTNR